MYVVVRCGVVEEIEVMGSDCCERVQTGKSDT